MRQSSTALMMPRLVTVAPVTVSTARDWLSMISCGMIFIGHWRRPAVSLFSPTSMDSIAFSLTVTVTGIVPHMPRASAV